MKSLQYRTLCVAVALLLGASALFAQDMSGHGRGGFGHMLGFYTDALDLTSAQQDQMRAILQKEKGSMKPLMQQMRQNREAMDALAESGPFDEAKATALATQNSQSVVQLEVAHARVKSEMMQVLTPDQKTKLQQIEAKHAARAASRQAPPTE